MEIGEECTNLVTPILLAKHGLAVFVDAVNLEDLLGKIETDVASPSMAHHRLEMLAITSSPKRSNAARAAMRVQAG